MSATHARDETHRRLKECPSLISFSHPTAKMRLNTLGHTCACISKQWLVHLGAEAQHMERRGFRPRSHHSLWGTSRVDQTSQDFKFHLHRPWSRRLNPRLVWVPRWGGLENNRRPPSSPSSSPPLQLHSFPHRLPRLPDTPPASLPLKHALTEPATS
jgi:hypothetical protein